MPNMTILQANVAAALTNKHLSRGEKQCMQLYAQQTAPGYCAGCANICESAVHLDVPVSDIMRYSMYYYSYGHRDTAVRLFNALPSDVRSNILKADYSKAEKYCPQRIEIGKILKKTLHDLS